LCNIQIRDSGPIGAEMEKSCYYNRICQLIIVKRKSYLLLSEVTASKHIKSYKYIINLYGFSFHTVHTLNEIENVFIFEGT
jgi:hypothetical protein